VDRPRERDQPQAQTWQVTATARSGTRKPTILSDGHTSEDDARQALVTLMEGKAQGTDWPPTRAAYERGVREAREQGRTVVVFTREYSVRQAPLSPNAA
jgi:hypothetical protein